MDKTLKAVVAQPAKPVLDTAQNAVKLGSADWYRSGGGVREMREGDFWLGSIGGGEEVGFRDDRHIMLCAGTRGGKGASVIIPNLLLWQGSAVVIDPKGENAMITARSRGKGSRFTRGNGCKVYILDPFDTVKTPLDDFGDVKARFNPMDLIDGAREDSADIAARIADAIIVSEASNDPYWEDSARGLLGKLILHVASSRDFGRDERNLVTVRRLLLEGDLSGLEMLARLAARPGKKESRLPSAHAVLFAAMAHNTAFGGVIAQAGRFYQRLEERGDRAFDSTLQVAITNTEFIDSPGMKRCLSQSDFGLSELKTDPKGASVYLCLPQRYMETHYRWLRMVVTMTVTEMENVRQRPASGHPVLMVLDEFPALRRMRVIENAAAQIAGFGVKMMFVCQTLAQLKESYKDNWETLVANAGVKLFFCNDDHFTRAYVSQLVGEREVVRTVRSMSETAGHSLNRSQSETQGVSSSQSASLQTKGGSASSSVSQSYSRSESHSESSSYSWTGGVSETIQRRALVTPDEVGRLFGDRDNPTALALISGYQPIFLTRSLYFRTGWLRGRYDPHPDHPLPLPLKETLALMAREHVEAEEEISRRVHERYWARIEKEAQGRKAAAEALKVRRMREAQRLADARRRDAEARRYRRNAWIKRAVYSLIVLGSVLLVVYLRFRSGG